MLAPLDPLPTAAGAATVAASLPRLAPRPISASATATTASWRTSESKPSPTRRQWDSHRAELAQLYLRQRRSLRFIMQHMEMVHGLKATAQIYKHNFARWGFQKNKKHLPPADHGAAVTQAATSGRKQPSQVRRDDSPLSASLITLAHQDKLVLALILHVRTWNSSFYEHRKGYTADNNEYPSPPSPPAWLTAQNARNLVITFELVSDLLKRGHGDLAGRMARKAFLLAESILETDPPALLWNLLGVMHRMLTSRHLRLLWMLLTHMTALVQRRYTRPHPLSFTLRHLRDFVGSFMNGSCLAVSSGETSPSAPDTPGVTTPDCHVLEILEKVWLLNSKMLFDHLDIGLTELYEHIKIDVCPVTPPAVAPDILKRWTIQLKESRALEHGLDAASPFQDTPSSISTLEALLLPPAAAEVPLPDQYSLVQRQIGTILRHVEDEILDGTSKFIRHAKLAIIVVAGLMVGQKLRETQPLIADLGGEGSSPSSDTESKHHALKTACIIRIILDSQASLAEVGCYIGWDTIAMNKCIVALYDYADADLDPQALQELMVLENALIEANQMDGARQVEMNRLQRLRQYVAEIPVGSA
ncbi:clr5 domain-containing protein [Sarocladium implicatum]|nr:clr5 domain-containing protein [Sarocladium implicatum]